MKKHFIILLFLPLILSCQRRAGSEKTKEFLKKYDKIRLISYNQHRDTYSNNDSISIINDTIKIPQIEIVDNIELHQNYSEKIFSILLSEKRKGTMADCYYPRHILLFYKNSKIIGFYEFSVGCGGCTQSDKIDIGYINTEQGKELIELFKEMKLKNNGEESDNYKYF